jgi:GNAT superfamily N-acetyltransferase
VASLRPERQARGGESALGSRLRDAARATGIVRALALAPFWLLRPRYDVFVFEHGPEAPYPAVPERPGREIRRLGPDELDLALAVHPAARRDELARRLAEGQEGRVVLEEGEPVYLRWDVFVDHDLPYLRATLRLDPGDHHPSGAYTRADRRGAGLHGALLAWSLGEARRRGCRRSIGFVPSWNVPALRAVAKPGWRGPVGAIGYWGVGRLRHFASGAVRLGAGASFEIAR